MTTVWALVLLLVFRRPVNAQPLIIDGNSTNILPDAISDLLDAVDLYNIRLGNQSLVYIPQPNPRGLRHLLGLSGLALQGAGTAETAREGLSRHAEIAIAASVPVTAIILMGLAAYGILHRRLKRQRRTADLENGMDPRLSGSSTESTRDSATSIAERGTKSKAFGLCGKWGAGDMQRSSSFEQVKAVAKVVQPANGQQAQQVKQAQQAGVAAQQQPRPSGDAGMENVIRRMDRPDTATEMLLMMPWSDWEIAPQELAICRRPDGSEWELGTGASGRVFKATRNGVQVVAIKIFQNVVVKSADHLLDQRQAIKKEVSILKSCHDRNIVQFIGACMQEGKTILVTEYLEGGDLHNALQKDHVGKLSWHRSPSGPRKSAPPLARRISLDIARGLHFLHSHKIVHFDLKSANILLGRDYTAKIADVGLAKILHDEFLSTLNNDVGTFAWAAPEVLLGNPCSEKVDIYSFGVVLWELTTGEEPRNRHLRAVRVPEECPAEVEAIMLRCRRENPAERPTAKELVDFFTDLLQAP
ncbi:hypothetical protein WJX72_001681 [[Myrmecia] bisecta]|uniref:Protein kinase domain-containing protein n=1 Tax=[Myrmecia] bisecta TaxID=41462 RepID=A0AAW1PT62_9CHLO